MTSPRATALSDQMDAANREDRARLTRIGNAARAFDWSSRLGKVFDRLWTDTVRGLTAKVVAGSSILCPHIPGAAATDAVLLLTWPPYLVRCPVCAGDQMTLGGAADCAACEAAQPSHTAVLHIPGRVLELAGRPATVPPLFAVLGLCEHCYDLEVICDD